MKIFRFVLLSILSILAFPAVCADDVDDFTLDVPDSGTQGEKSNSTSSDVLNDFGGEQQLFDESIPDVPLTNSGKKMGDSTKPPQAVGDKIENPVGKLTNSVPTSPQPAANSSSQNAKKTDNLMPDQITQPANPIIKQSESTPALSSSQEMPEQAPTVTAPQPVLQGDGSLAPVRQPEFLPTSNEFGGVPALPGTRRAMAPGEAPEIYGVEEGDTMFDVCSQLIDDGNYWPKLWSLNPDVRNPHFIYPGMKLAFYGGDDETPPHIEVVAEDEVVPVEKGEIKEAELVVEAEEVPSTGREGASIVQTPPPSAIVQQPASSSIDEATVIVSPTDIGADSDALDGFIFSGRQFSRDDVDFVVPAFVFAEEPSVLGDVVSGPVGEQGFINDQRILLNPSDEMGPSTYTILRPSGDVRSLKSGDFIGYRYEFAGNVRVLRKTKGGLLEGVAFDVRTPIHSGDIVVNFIATKRNIPSASSVGATSTANSSVIGFQDEGKNTGSKGDLVFLEKAGLSVGSFYTIFKTEINREVSHADRDVVREDGGSVAVVRVVEIVGESALGYIVAANAEVKVGDSLTLQ